MHSLSALTVMYLCHYQFSSHTLIVARLDRPRTAWRSLRATFCLPNMYIKQWLVYPYRASYELAFVASLKGQPLFCFDFFFTI